MKRHVFLPALGAAVALLAGLASGVAAGPGGTIRAAGSATFADPAGDANGAPDVTTVVVGDDPSAGTVTIAVTAGGLRAHTRVNVLLDTDRNRATGQWNGSDHFLHYWVSPRSSGWSLTRWTGKDWQPVPRSASTSFLRSGDVCTWTLGRQDLGGTSGFAIRVAGVLTDAGGKKVLARDEAPDTGSWAYVLSSNPPPTTQSTPTRPERVARPVIGRPTTVPARPVAGRRLTVRFPVVRSDDGTPLTGGKMTCDPSVAGKVVPHAERLANGVARLTFVVPPRARGRLLKVKVTIELDGRSATRVATFRVR